MRLSPTGSAPRCSRAVPIVMSTPLETLTYHLSNMPLAGSFGYLIAVYLLHKFMSSREQISIPRALLVVYNAAQVVINGYVAWKIAEALGGRVWGIGLKDTSAVRYGVYLHMLCKYLDYTDTLIILLRKKSEQLSFLHLWHHATILVVWGWVVNTWPTAEENGSAAYAYGAWINSCVHVIMYFYCARSRRAPPAAHHVYCPSPPPPPRPVRPRRTHPLPARPATTDGLTAVGIKPPPPVKKAVTVVQLTQFASCITVAIAALFLDVTPVFYNGVQVAYHIGMLYLFLPLLLGKGKGARKGTSSSVSRTPAQREVTKTE